MTCHSKVTYLCPNGHRTGVIDSEEGVSPYLIQCPECGEKARSEGYFFAGHINYTHMFYMPGIEEIRQMTDQQIEQYKNKVLFLKKIEK